MENNTAILNCEDKIITFKFDYTLFAIDLTEGDLYDSWSSFEDKSIRDWHTNFYWSEDEESEPYFCIYPTEYLKGGEAQIDTSDEYSINIVKKVGSREDYFKTEDMTTQTTTLNRIIEELRDLNEFDGETMEFLIKELGYEEYMTRSLVLRAPKEDIVALLEEKDELEKVYRPLLKWRYTVSSGSFWASFDEGEVEAFTYEGAVDKALDKLRYDFQKVNDALAFCDTTRGFSVDFDPQSLEVESI